MKYFEDSVKTDKDSVYINIWAIRDDAKNVYHSFDELKCLVSDLNKAKLATKNSIERAEELISKLHELDNYLSELTTGKHINA